MNLSRIALVSAVTTVIAWTAKSVAIGLAGGLDRSPAESPLFLLGFAAQLVAVVALALAVSAGRPAAVRGGAVLAAAVAVVAVVTLVGLVVARVQPEDPSWVWAEVNLWVVAPLVLAFAVAADRPRGYAEPRPSRNVSTVS